MIPVTDESLRKEVVSTLEFALEVGNLRVAFVESELHLMAFQVGADLTIQKHKRLLKSLLLLRFTGNPDALMTLSTTSHILFGSVAVSR